MIVGSRPLGQARGQASRPVPARAGSEYILGDRHYCHAFTVSDHTSRYLLMCEAFCTTKERPVIEAFLVLFRDRGLSSAIRTDNGLPFALPNGFYNLSKLSVSWLRLGIKVERTKPGHPQARFDAFVKEFVDEHPRDARSLFLSGMFGETDWSGVFFDRHFSLISLGFAFDDGIDIFAKRFFPSS